MYKLWSCHVRCLYPDTTTTHRHGLSVLVDDFEDAVNDGTIHLQLLRKVGSRSAESIACTSAPCEFGLAHKPASCCRIQAGATQGGVTFSELEQLVDVSCKCFAHFREIWHTHTICACKAEVKVHPNVNEVFSHEQYIDL